MPSRDADGHRAGRHYAADVPIPAPDPEPTPDPSDAEPSLPRQLVLLLLKVAMVLGFVAMVFLFLFGVTQAPDESMRPAVREGDLVVYYRLQRDYAAGDLVVVDDGGTREVRRVVAVAGDEVDFSADGLVINGYLQSEQGIYAETEPFADGITYPVESPTRSRSGRGRSS